MVTLKITDKPTITNMPQVGKRIKVKAWDVGKDLVDRVQDKPWESMKVNNSSVSFGFGDARLTMNFPEGAVRQSTIEAGGFRRSDSIKDPSPAYPRTATRVVFGNELPAYPHEYNPTIMLEPGKEVEMGLIAKQKVSTIAFQLDDYTHMQIILDTVEYPMDRVYTLAQVKITEPPTEIALTVGGETTIYEIEK